MSKRLQVVVKDEELERYGRSAEAVGLSVSEWARQALRAAERATSGGDVEDKLAVIRTAAGHRFPAPDIDAMLAETEAAYLAGIETGLAGTDDE